MTVRELINQLEYYDDDMEVVIKASNSMYVDSIRTTSIRDLRAAWGDDTEVIVIKGDQQVGSV